jgi:hypothetical protein
VRTRCLRSPTRARTRRSRCSTRAGHRPRRRGGAARHGPGRLHRRRQVIARPGAEARRLPGDRVHRDHRRLHHAARDHLRRGRHARTTAARKGADPGRLLRARNHVRRASRARHALGLNALRAGRHVAAPRPSVRGAAGRHARYLDRRARRNGVAQAGSARVGQGLCLRDPVSESRQVPKGAVAGKSGRLRSLGSLRRRLPPAAAKHLIPNRRWWRRFAGEPPALLRPLQLRLAPRSASEPPCRALSLGTDRDLAADPRRRTSRSTCISGLGAGRPWQGPPCGPAWRPDEP